MESLGAANTKFSLDLFKKISESKKTDNIFYSPLSISSALAMVYMGARGNTATQIAEVSSPRHTDDDIHAGFNKLMSELNKEGAPYALSLANRLYGEQSYEFVEKYIQDTKKFYQAELETVDFKKKAEDERVKINSWVEKQTQEKIKNLLAAGIVHNMTRLVLVNAIYFKGNWDNKFKEANTKEVPFELSKNESKPVQMMHQKAKFGLGFIPEVSCHILEMPYIGKELSMLIILPREIEDDSTGLERLERELTYEKLIQWTQPENMGTPEVNVALPKFKMEESYDLEDILVSMGMKDAFLVSKSDFSGMSPSDDLVVSKVVHKAFVEVNEEGTEAAAATAVKSKFRCGPIRFTADHPFLFFIRHNPTQSILFYGRFCSP
ncbi:leukocyte elastase inhibitor-like isoform X2 [Conger conger]|uniref:leukocyte elastase inhibitor-like isoform X2 n=1 Tax=Conger conger TaxID=82655 RepID=UPI002A599F19|nr:leukocyte elastase inhibitor-like isoform X2 [Conger conger]XP_061095556.1 leukocyte elastase inhibitor-like isoform X2 [Conger conger]